MAEPGTDPAGGQAAPPPPPPPPQTETADTAGGHAATPPQPPQTETVGPGPVPTPPPQNQTAVQTAGQPQVQPQPRPQTGMGEVAGQPRTPRAPSQVRASAADAEEQPPAPSPPPPPPPPPQQQQQKDKGERSKQRRDEAEASAASGRKEMPPKKPAPTDGVRGSRLKEMLQKKGRLVKWLMSWYRRHRSPEKPAAASAEESKSKEGKVEEITKQPSMPAQGDKPPEEKQETHKKRPQEEEQPEGVVAGDTVDKPTDGVLLKKLQKMGRFVKSLMSWYRPHRSQEEPKAASGEESKSKEGKNEEITKQTSMPAQGDKPPEEHEKWPQEAARLEKILEEAFDGLLAADFRELGNKERKCLLTFSVFALASEVKKQAVTYWWATRFELSPEDVFTKLSGDGFLEPIKNRCSGVIHGCRVNPLVHWMVKRQAKYADLLDERVELDERGDLRKKQPKSEVLCLTAGNRVQLQRLAKDESKARRPKKPEDPQPAPTHTQGSQNGKTRPEDEREAADRELREAAELRELRDELKNKRVILNVSAHVYRLPLPASGPLLSDLANSLVVLQLGRWWNSDNDTYMEVEGLESLRAIGSLKNLRYLSLRGLSRLTELPSEIGQLKRLAILDVRGCQNLVKVKWPIKAQCQNLVKVEWWPIEAQCQNLVKVEWRPIKAQGLTHLDLTECYMLEHISREVITSLSELRVFKGFVFGVGPAGRSKACWRRSRACRLQDLKKLVKLEKLSVNVTTDAHVGKGEMAELQHLEVLRSLTVTWGELPSILDVESPDERTKDRRDKLLEKWTGLVLPLRLEKLDVRCYPGEVLPNGWFVGRENLKKLYVRGGKVNTLDFPKTNYIKILRLRYLKHFEMKWDALHDMLEKVDYVEVVIKDPKVMKIERRDKEVAKEDHQKVSEEKMKKKEEAKEEELRLMASMKKKMSIPGSTLDENGVWVRDKKEEENKQEDGKKGEGTQGGADKSNGKLPNNSPSSPFQNLRQLLKLLQVRCQRRKLTKLKLLPAPKRPLRPPRRPEKVTTVAAMPAKRKQLRPAPMIRTKKAKKADREAASEAPKKQMSHLPRETEETPPRFPARSRKLTVATSVKHEQKAKKDREAVLLLGCPRKQMRNQPGKTEETPPRFPARSRKLTVATPVKHEQKAKKDREAVLLLGCPRKQMRNQPGKTEETPPRFPARSRKLTVMTPVKHKQKAKKDREAVLLLGCPRKQMRNQPGKTEETPPRFPARSRKLTVATPVKHEQKAKKDKEAVLLLGCPRKLTRNQPGKTE